jgi:hypothetical protein
MPREKQKEMESLSAIAVRHIIAGSELFTNIVAFFAVFNENG